MASKLTKNLTLPRQAIQEKGMVILPLKEYEKMWTKMGKLEKERRTLMEEVKVLAIIAEGEQEYKEGKLKAIKSLAQLD